MIHDTASSPIPETAQPLAQSTWDFQLDHRSKVRVSSIPDDDNKGFLPSLLLCLPAAWKRNQEHDAYFLLSSHPIFRKASSSWVSALPISRSSWSFLGGHPPSPAISSPMLSPLTYACKPAALPLPEKLLLFLHQLLPGDWDSSLVLCPHGDAALQVMKLAKVLPQDAAAFKVPWHIHSILWQKRKATELQWCWEGILFPG